MRGILPIAGPPAVKPARIYGRPSLVVVWDARQWAVLPESERPDDAFEVGRVWVAIRPGPA